ERGLQAAIRRWYRGAVVGIKALRPASQIMDEAIPTLLRTVRQPTFLTINVADFWRRMNADPRFAVICFALPGKHAAEVSLLLRRALGTPPFVTRRGGMGKIARVTRRQIQFYTADSWAVRVTRLAGTRR